MLGVSRQRPLGITIIAIILAVGAILSLLGIILLLVGVNALTHNGVADAIATVAVVIIAITAIVELILAWGLWTLKAWAFWATVIVEAIRLLNALFTLLVRHNGAASIIISLIISLVVLIYLFADRNVRAAFRT